MQRGSIFGYTARRIDPRKQVASVRRFGQCGSVGPVGTHVPNVNGDRKINKNKEVRPWLTTFIAVCSQGFAGQAATAREPHENAEDPLGRLGRRAGVPQNPISRGKQV